MAKAQKQEKSMEAALWESANKLRGAVEPAEYKHVVLSLIFLKYASDKFEERRQEIIAEGHEAFVDNVAFYAMKSVFYLPPESRWSYIMEQSKQSDIALKIDTALYTIEKTTNHCAVLCQTIIILDLVLIRQNLLRCSMKLTKLN